MAKYVNIDKLKPILEPILTDDNSTTTIESIMGIVEDIDEEAALAKVAEAEAKGREAATAEYAQKLRSMFFGGGEGTVNEPAVTVENKTVDIPEQEKETYEVEESLFYDDEVDNN